MHRLRHAAVQLRALSRGALPRALATALLTLAASRAWAAAQSTPSATPGAQATSAGIGGPAEARPEFYIREYRVLGAHHLQPIEIEAAVYPFLGPDRTVKDVEGARAALLKERAEVKFLLKNSRAMAKAIVIEREKRDAREEGDAEKDGGKPKT